MKTLYYESHVTIDPVQGEELESFKEACSKYGFRVAKLLMQKGSELVPSNIDSFCTTRGESFAEVTHRTVELVRHLDGFGFVVRRYKVEATLIDSKVYK